MHVQVHYDVVIVDQVAVVIPFLKYLTRSRVLFYCHFPDMLLAQRKSLIKRVYRWVSLSSTFDAPRHRFFNGAFP